MDIRYPATPEERPRILVVEPNRTNLGVMARRLSEAGFRLTTADSGASAIAELYRRRSTWCWPSSTCRG